MIEEINIGKALDFYEVDRLFSYDPLTGDITRKITRCGRAIAGERAGSKHTKGYLQIWVNGNHYLSHRIAWLLYYGAWPEKLDHINGIKSDNKIKNLREVDHHINMKNQSLRSTNKSGVMGVQCVKKDKKWVARITDRGVTEYLGFYGEWWDAVCVRKSAESRLGFHVNHGRI